MRKLVTVLATGALVAGMIGACSADDDGADGGSANKTYKIGMANFTLGAPYFIGMSDAVKAQAEKSGRAEIVSTDARGDATQLTTDVESLLAQNVDGIIISGGPLESAPAALNAIKQADKPVVLVDRKFSSGDYTSWIGPDNAAIGRQDGEYIVERLEGSGKLLVIKGGPADNSIGLARTEGVLSVVSKESGIEVITAPAFGNWSSDGGLAVMEDMLARHPDLKAVFCENDSMCLGAQKAISDAGRSDGVFLAAVDGQKEALKAIMDGTNFEVTGRNDSGEIGTKGLDRMLEILDGKDVEKDTVLPSPRVTKENAAEYYDPNSIF
jgi:ribose transport system substrate-binding protein